MPSPIDSQQIPILPYNLIVGQEKLKLALELAYIAPRLGGVLISGQRGTGKSTAVRAFTQMMCDELPVTLPINATEDRVVGGLDVDQLMESKAEWKNGLLVEANESQSKVLYIDEINLLDDHIVNIILDVASTGKLNVQRDGKSQSVDVSFTLIGTMNPEEGGLRPQLLDRFDLMVDVNTARTPEARLAILENVLDFEDAVSEAQEGKPDKLQQQQADNTEISKYLKFAKKLFPKVSTPKSVLEQCVTLADKFQVEGNRGERGLALAAKAYTARQAAYLMNAQAQKIPKSMITVTPEALLEVAPLAFQHRRMSMEQGQSLEWQEQDTEELKRILGCD